MKLDFRPSSPDERATFGAINRAIALILVPGGLFIFGLIAWLKPDLPPPATLNGCYGAGPAPMIRIGSGGFETLDGSARSSSAQVRVTKGRYQLALDHGYMIRERSREGISLIDAYPSGQVIPVLIDKGHVSLLMPAEAGEMNMWKQDCPGTAFRNH